MVDEQLCRVVDRIHSMGCSRTLEVELRFTEYGSDVEKYGFAKILPEFREMGIVTIIDTTHADRVLHSSAQNNSNQGCTTSFLQQSGVRYSLKPGRVCDTTLA